MVLLKLDIWYLMCLTDIIEGLGQKLVHTFLDLKPTQRPQFPSHPQKALVATNEHSYPPLALTSILHTTTYNPYAVIRAHFSTANYLQCCQRPLNTNKISLAISISPHMAYIVNYWFLVLKKYYASIELHLGKKEGLLRLI